MNSSAQHTMLKELQVVEVQVLGQGQETIKASLTMMELVLVIGVSIKNKERILTGTTPKLGTNTISDLLGILRTSGRARAVPMTGSKTRGRRKGKIGGKNTKKTGITRKVRKMIEDNRKTTNRNRTMRNELATALVTHSHNLQETRIPLRVV